MLEDAYRFWDRKIAFEYLARHLNDGTPLITKRCFFHWKESFPEGDRGGGTVPSGPVFAEEGERQPRGALPWFLIFRNQKPRELTSKVYHTTCVPVNNTLLGI